MDDIETSEENDTTDTSYCSTSDSEWDQQDSKSNPSFVKRIKKEPIEIEKAPQVRCFENLADIMQFPRHYICKFIYGNLREKMVYKRSELSDLSTWCKICHIGFKSFVDFEYHYKTHEEVLLERCKVNLTFTPEENQCENCGECFENQYKLLIHKQKNFDYDLVLSLPYGESMFKCPMLCNDVLYTRADYYIHWEAQHSARSKYYHSFIEKSKYCKLCEKDYAKHMPPNHVLENHFPENVMFIPDVDVAEEEWNCDKCNYSYQNSLSVTRSFHNQFHHSRYSQIFRDCSVHKMTDDSAMWAEDSVATSSKDNLVNNIREEADNTLAYSGKGTHIFVCKICKENFPHIDVLYKHIADVHLQLLVVLCSVCGPVLSAVNLHQHVISSHEKNVETDGARLFGYSEFGPNGSMDPRDIISKVTLLCSNGVSVPFCDEEKDSGQNQGDQSSVKAGEINAISNVNKNNPEKADDNLDPVQNGQTADKNRIVTCFCNVCDTKFTEVGKCYEHIIQNHLSSSANEYCYQCKHFFPDKFTFGVHVHYKHHRCYVCLKVFESGNSFKYHQVMAHSSGSFTYQCHVCKQNDFKREGSLFGHLKGIHAGVVLHRRKSKFCPTCGKQVRDIKSHMMNVHASCIECKICKELIPNNPTAIVKHKGKHVEYVKYQCEKCPYGTHNLKLFKRHVNIHNETLDFFCKLCLKGFKSKRNLKYHIESPKSRCVGKDNPKLGKVRKREELKCTECDYITWSQGALNNHKGKTHPTKGKSFACKECGTAFGSQSSLYRHMNDHKPDHLKLKYQCKICDKFFPNTGSLNRHKDIHKSVKFQCPHCISLVRQKTAFIDHLRKRHPDFDLSTELEQFKVKVDARENTLRQPKELQAKLKSSSTKDDKAKKRSAYDNSDSESNVSADENRREFVSFGGTANVTFVNDDSKTTDLLDHVVVETVIEKVAVYEVKDSNIKSEHKSDRE